MAYEYIERYDTEEKSIEADYLNNTKVFSLTWHDLNVVVKDRATKEQLPILQNVSGRVAAGEMLALMGPSGSGKTTLLDLLARRNTRSSSVSGEMFVNGVQLGHSTFQSITSYVEQEDALIGSLTVRETLKFSARLSPRVSGSRSDLAKRERLLLERFGLVEQGNTLIGTPLCKGVSGGQRRRVSVASQVITGPKILFLDEPTSGLDSAASFEVISFLKDVARRYNLLVIASIHQPSTSTFALFDKLLLLSKGRTCYFGETSNVVPYFGSIGFSVPLHINPAEFLLDITNVDFARVRDAAFANLEWIHTSWVANNRVNKVIPDLSYVSMNFLESTKYTNSLQVTLVLLHRMYIKSYRDVVAYGIRIAMYIGLAIMMGTVWLRLPTTQSSIQPFINAIFFGSAFMSFMAVAYVPAYLEDFQTYRKDRSNGLYGPLPFLIANFLVGLPYLFAISVIFSVIAYWLANFRPDGNAFMTWIMWLFLDLIVAESLVVLVASIFPIFVVSLAIVAFANGLWMSVGGFLVQPTVLNAFWKYVFHYIDYQAYVFQGMMVNEFSERVYDCDVLSDGTCDCMYPSELASQCRIQGTAVLDRYGYGNANIAEWVGILLVIIVCYRLLGYLALWLRK